MAGKKTARVAPPSAPTTPTPFAGKGLVRAIAVLIAAVAFLAYLPALKGSFVNWDDGLYIYQNRAMLDEALRTPGWFLTAVVAANWHPLTLLSYALDIRLFGAGPFGFHLTNVALHAANSALVFLVVRSLMGAGRGMAGRADLAAAVATALLFALHPLHVESVAWISERKDVLYALFYLLSVLAYLSFKSGNAKGFYLLSLLLFALSVLGKPMAVTLPAVLLILDYYPLKKLSRQAIVEKLPFFAVSIASAIVTLWAQGEGGALRTLETYPLAIRALVAVRALAFYLYKTVLPLDLAPVYPYPEGLVPTSPEVVAPLALITAVTISAIWLRKRTRLPLALWLFFVVTLLPVVGIVQVGSQAAADRYMYMASLAPLILASLGASALCARLGRRGPWAFAASAGVVLVVMGALTVKQIAIWRDPFTLWRHEIALYPKSSLAFDNLANAYFDQGSFRESIPLYGRAIELLPGYAKGWYNRGDALFRLGDFKGAIADYTEAIRRDPSFAEAFYNRGTTYSKIGDIERALEDYNRTIELMPDHEKVYNNRGNAFYRLGRYERALEDYNRALEISPDSMDALINRGAAYAEKGELEAALRDYDGALAIGKTARAYNNRGIAMMKAGRLDEALSDFGAALEIEPENAASLYYAGLAFMKVGDRARAKEALARAANLGSVEARRALDDTLR